MVHHWAAERDAVWVDELDDIADEDPEESTPDPEPVIGSDP